MMSDKIAALYGGTISVSRPLRRCMTAGVFVSLLGTAALAAPTAPASANPDGTGPSPTSGFGQAQSLQVSAPLAGPLFASPFSDDHLFGDWGGLHKRLKDHGVIVNLDWLTENAGNVTGGRRKGFDFSGQVALSVDFDLNKIMGWKDTAFHFLAVNGNGRSLSPDYLGDGLAAPQEIYGGRGNVVAHLVWAYGEKAFFDKHLNLAGGWLPVGSFFAASPLNCRLMNVITCGNPHPLPNYPGEADWPQASFGGIARYWFSPELYAMVGLFSVENDFGTGGGGSSGWAWADPHKSGVSVPVELAWIPSFGHDKLVGHYKFGFDHDTHRYPDVSNTTVPEGERITHPREMWYVTADQMLMRQGPGLTDGLIAFGGYVHGSPNVSPLKMQIFAGLTTTGAAWHRKADTVSVAWHVLQMSSAFTRAQEAAEFAGASFPLTIDGFTAYGPQNTEQLVEANYAIAVYRGVTFMPDFQYMIRPGATTRTPDAAILGFRSNINF